MMINLDKVGAVEITDNSTDYLKLSECKSFLAVLQQPLFTNILTLYCDTAIELIRLLESDDRAAHADSLNIVARSFARHARTLDMSVALAVLQWKSLSSDIEAARKIRRSLERALVKAGGVISQGILTIVLPQSQPIECRMHSNFGRWLGEKLSKVSGHKESVDADYSQAKILSSTKKALRQKDIPLARQLMNQLLSQEVKLSRELLLTDAEIYQAEKLAVYAVARLEQVLSMAPKDIDVLSRLAQAYQSAGDLEKEHACIGKMLAQDPTNTGVMSDFARSAAQLGNYDQAIEVLRSVLKINPNNQHAQLLLSSIYAGQGLYAEAAVIYQEVLRKEPNNPTALKILGAVRVFQKAYDEAIAIFDRALRADPQNLDIAYVKAYAHLHKGDYAQAWPLYDRFVGNMFFRPAAVVPHLPQWNGETNRDLTLMLWAEQGLGDAIQFIRFAKFCRDRVGKLMLVCPQELTRLFEEMRLFDEIAPKFDVAPTLTVQASLMSLPRIFETTLDTIPHDIPYLTVSDAARQKWSGRIPQTGKRKIGLVWKGTVAANHTTVAKLTAERRNIPLQALKPLFDKVDAEFYSLQWPREDAFKERESVGVLSRCVDVMDGVCDFMDTAALIEQLDLVITVDTSTAHLAAAMGKPVWILSRYDGCWRWLDNKPTDNPWYPHVRVFGQPSPADWGSVVESVCAELGAR